MCLEGKETASPLPFTQPPSAGGARVQTRLSFLPLFLNAASSSVFSPQPEDAGPYFSLVTGKSGMKKGMGEYARACLLDDEMYELDSATMGDGGCRVIVLLRRAPPLTLGEA